MKSGKGISMGNIGMGKAGAGGNQRTKPRDSKSKHKKGSRSGGDLKYLKELIQKLCKNTTPLSKSLDFIRDDIDNMNKEKEKWR